MTTQHSPLVFSGDGWLALMRDGKPVALKRAQTFEEDPSRIECYWKPVTDADAARYRLTLPVLD